MELEQRPHRRRDLDAKELIGWKARRSHSVFPIQWPEHNGQGPARQGYNSCRSEPLNRSRLLTLVSANVPGGPVRLPIGKLVPTYDFNNVAVPLPRTIRNWIFPPSPACLHPDLVNPPCWRHRGY